MPGINLPTIDIISLAAGVIGGLILIYLLRRFSGIGSWFKSFFHARADSVKKRSISAVEDHLRREIIKMAQGQHTAWSLFSLDEVAFEPRLLAPPVHIEPGDVLPVDELLSTCLSYLPDWPEFPARFEAPTLSFAEALEGGKNIALIGQPGSGKTFALAWLASEISRRNPLMGTLGSKFPVFVHVSDLQISNHENDDPLQPIISILNEIVPVYVLPQVGTFVRSQFASGNVLFLVDGLDEHPPAYVREITNYLKSILRDFPGTRLIVSASSDYIDGLAGIGLYPLALAAWSEERYNQYLHRWDKLWNEHIRPELAGRNLPDSIDPALLNSWLRTESQSWTPLEYTLKIWAAYAGDLKGAQPIDAIEAYLLRCVSDARLWPPLERLALQMITTAQPVISRHKAGSWVTEFDAPLEHQDESPMLMLGDEQRQTEKQLDKDKQAIGQVRHYLPECFNTGILIEHPSDRLSFNHPIIAGFLAARAMAESENLAAITMQQNWAGKSQALRFLSAIDPSGAIVESTIKAGEEPLFIGLFQAARWLKDAPASIPWKNELIKRLIEIMQSENLPMGSRQRAAAALTQSGDPNIPALFRQNLASDSQNLRQIAILGCGAMAEAKAVNDLVSLQDDPSRLVRYATCMALAFLEDNTGLEPLIESLYKGDEDLRRAAAEALARHSATGHGALKDGAASEDILVRRAVVFGLAQINETWAADVLEKLRLEDGQWIVRSAASQALETGQQGNPRIPRQLPLPSEAGWLVTFASQQGIGLQGGSFATEMLLKALKTGTEDERLASLEYLVQKPEEEVIRSVIHSIYVDSGNISEAALVTLWRLAIGGATIPAPNLYGIGA